MNNKMKIKLNINLLIILIFLLIAYQLYFIKFAYLLIIPGLFIIIILREYDFNKAILFSIPLSLIFYILPYFIITRAGIPIPYFIYLMMPLLQVIYLFNSKRIKIVLIKKTNLIKTSLIIVILIIFVIVFNPYFLRKAIPLTAGANGLYTIKIIKDSIISKGIVPSWTDHLFAGQHLFYTYPPLAQLSTTFLTLIPTEQLYQTYNNTFTFMTLYLLFSTFMLLKKLGLSSYSSLISLIPLTGFPFIIGELTFAGNITSAFMYSLYPIVLYGLFSLFDKNKLKELIIYGISFAGFFLSYHYISYFIVISFAFTYLIAIILFKNKKLLTKNVIIYSLISGLLILTWLINYLVFNNYLILSEREGLWNTPLKNITEFLSYITATGTEQDMYKHLVTFTPLFFYLGLISSLMIFRLKKNKLTITKQDFVILLYLIACLFMMIVEIFPFHTLIPLRTHYYLAYRYWIIIIPLMIFSIGRLIDNLLNINKQLLIPITILFLIIFSGMINYSSINVNSWLNEKAIIDEGSFKSIYDIIKPSEGRIAIYGIYGPAIIPAISNWTGASMFAGYNFQRHSTRDYYHKIIMPLTDSSMDFLKSNVSSTTIYNTYQKAWVNTLIFNVCNKNGFEAFNKTVQYNGYSLIANSKCIKVLTLTNKSNLAELITNHSGINYHKISDTEYILKPLTGDVLIKIAYFPKWHAYQDGKELKITKSNDGFIIIHNNSESTIKLVMKPYYSEIITLIIFSVTIIFLLYKLLI